MLNSGKASTLSIVMLRSLSAEQAGKILSDAIKACDLKKVFHYLPV